MSKFSDFNAYTKQGIIPLLLLGIPQKKAMTSKAFTQPVLTAAKPCDCNVSGVAGNLV